MIDHPSRGRTTGSITESLPEPVFTKRRHRIGDAIACWQKAAIIYDESGFPHHAAEVRWQLETAQITPRSPPNNA
jgi:hypothetical protein